MNKYHFSCGNSTRGAVGLCAQVVAATREEAASKLRSVLEANLGPLGAVPIHFKQPFVEYINVYISPENIEASQLEE
jgi:hypothetical protein